MQSIASAYLTATLCAFRGSSVEDLSRHGQIWPDRTGSDDEPHSQLTGKAHCTEQFVLMDFERGEGGGGGRGRSTGGIGADFGVL